jgi:hypothetical protein
MRKSALILGLAFLIAPLAPAGATTPAQQAAAANKARMDAAARARSDAEAKARANAQAAARARLDAAITAQRKAAVEAFVRSQEAARAKAYARSAYVVANVPRPAPSAQLRVAAPPAAKSPIHHRPAATFAHQARRAGGSGHGR